jgi:hypothetical protein
MRTKEDEMRHGWSGGSVEGSIRRLAVDARLDELTRQVEASRRGANQSELRERAAEKIAQRAPLTRREAAAYAGVSTRKLQRMEAAGKLQRCPNMGTVVRYAARDVQRLFGS